MFEHRCTPASRPLPPRPACPQATWRLRVPAKPTLDALPPGWRALPATVRLLRAAWGAAPQPLLITAAAAPCAAAQPA